MEKHRGLIESIIQNALEDGTAILLMQSPERMSFVGTCETPELLDFLETMFRTSPAVKALFDEASERAECPLI